MIYIIGGNGLTGSAIVRHLTKYKKRFEIIQRENAHKYVNQRCDILIYANGNAFKYKAARDPFYDFEASLKSLAFYIHNIKFNKFIFLSTVDVYPEPSCENLTLESTKIDASMLSVYGFHKLLAEEYVKKFSKCYLIFRLSALVGKGLNKNPIYDFLHNHKKMFISKESYLNVINTDFIASSIFHILKKNIKNETFNLCSRNSIKIDDIKNLVNFDSLYHNNSNDFLQKYFVNTKKIQKYITLTSSEEAILNYYCIIKGDNYKEI